MLKLSTTFNHIGAAIAVGVMWKDANLAITSLASLHNRRTLYRAVELAIFIAVHVPVPEVIVVIRHANSLVKVDT
jgi:hypothetical protein